MKLTMKSAAAYTMSRIAPQALLNSLRTKGEADHPALYEDLPYAKYTSDGKRTLILTPKSETVIGWVEPGLGWLDEKGYQLLHEEAVAIRNEEVVENARVAIDYDDYGDDEE